MNNYSKNSFTCDFSCGLAAEMLSSSRPHWRAGHHQLSTGAIPSEPRSILHATQDRGSFFSGETLRHTKARTANAARTRASERLTKGPGLMTSEARLISVNDPVAFPGKSALRRSPRSYGWIPAITGVFVRWSAPSLDASSARHGLACKGELCPERRVSPSWMTSTASTNDSSQARTDRLTEEMRQSRFSVVWRKSNLKSTIHPKGNKQP